MSSPSDPSFFLQLSESFIKTARLDSCGEVARLSALREISSAELASQPNPILQIAGADQVAPIPVAATLSLGETIYLCQSFDKVGFSTLTEFINQENAYDLDQYELGVFQQSNGLPAPTASPTSLELVFCGFNSRIIPEIAEAFPNLDTEPTSITLAVLDLFRFIRSQCGEGENILLVEIANENTHLFQIGNQGLMGIQTVDMGRNALYAAMAEVLHLHYIGSAVKLFTRSGFDSTELAPTLGMLFGTAIQSALEAANWQPSRVHLTGLVRAQSWFQEAVLRHLGLNEFGVDESLLPFTIDESVGKLSPMDTEILAKIFTSITADDDFSWHNDYLGSLGKSASIPRREPNGSNPPFPTAHPDRVVHVASSAVQEVGPSREGSVEPAAVPYAPPPETASASNPRKPANPQPVPVEKNQGVRKEVAAIPAHLLRDIEEYEGEFEDFDDFGGGTGRLVIKVGLLFLSVVIIGVLVTVVFFPKASEKYLGIRPPHIKFQEPDPDQVGGRLGSRPNAYVSSVEVTDTDVAQRLQDLQQERENVSFGGLYLPTNPSGATVIIGNMAPQISPIKLPNVVPGTYEIIISKDGYESQTVTVTIEPKQVKRIETVHLQRLR